MSKKNKRKKSRVKKPEIQKKQNALIFFAITAAAVVAAFAFELIIFAVNGNFNVARVVLLAIFAAASGIIYKFRLYKNFETFYDPSRKRHRMAAVLLCAACVFISILMSVLLHINTNDIQYPLKNSVDMYNPYIQQFDAFKKGQLHIDYQPDPRLAALENPYDFNTREAMGIPYLWDRAYYNGRYYSYFMIAPILTLYYPHYIIRGTLPADDYVLRVFAIMTALFFTLSIIKWAGDYTRRLPLTILFVGAGAALFSTQVFLVSRGLNRIYYLATIAGMAYAALFIFLLLCALSTIPGKNRYILFVLSGVAYSLTFLSRMNIALLLAFAIVPAVWFKIIKPNLKDKKNLFAELASLGIPVLLTAVFQMWYNKARFSGIFDFGVTYQLTVSDISLNRIRILDIFPAIYHYFLQPLLFWDFPFITLQWTSLKNYGHYVYVDTNFGLFSIPMFFALFGGVKVFMDKNVQTGFKITLASVLAGILAIAWINFSLAGVIFRYTCDLTLVAAFVSIVIVFYLCDNVSEIRKPAVYIYTTAFCVVSLLYSLFFALSSNDNLSPYSSNVRMFFKNLFI